MFFPTWLRNQATNPRANRSTAPRQRQVRFRPGVEVLEDRAVPAMLNVTTPLDVINANDGLLSLREAVLESSASNGADTIVVPAGTYALTLAGADENGALTGDLDLAGHLTIRGAGAGATVIDSAGLDGVFHILAGGDVTLSGMTIQGGIGRVGGGIVNVGALTLDASILSGNTATTHGGGIFNAGLLVVKGTTITGNQALLEGGGIYNDYLKNLRIANSILSENQAHGGGGISNSGFATVREHTLWANLGTDGGGIFNWGTLQVNGSTISSHNADGIYNRGTLTLNNSTLSGNAGIGIANLGTLTMHMCILTGNGHGIVNLGMSIVHDSSISSNYGHGIYNEGSLTLRDSTILGNFADLGADVYNLGDLLIYDSVIGDLYDATL